MDLSCAILLLTATFTVVKCTESRKYKVNLKGFDPSVVLHALVSDDEVQQSDISGGTLTDSISPIKGFDKVDENGPGEDTKKVESNDSHKTKKRHNKGNKKHKKRKNKGKNKSKKSKSCCENGGLCVLGSFCHCPKNFVGRFCEFEVRSRDCGPVKHEEVFRQGCTLCRCMDGVLNCIPGMYGDCDKDQVEPIFFNFNQVNNNNEEVNTKLIVTADDNIKAHVSSNKGQGDNKMTADILQTLEKMAASSAASDKIITPFTTYYMLLSILMLLVNNIEI